MVRRLAEWGLASCSSDKVGSCQIRKMVCKSGLKPSIEVRPKQVSVQFSSVAQSCSTPCDPMNRSTRPPSTNSQSSPKPVSIESVMDPTISSSVIPFSSCPQYLQTSGSFAMSQLFISGGQTIGVSASKSVLPRNTQDWSPLGWTGWICLQSKGPSRVFSTTTVQKHQFLSAQLSL